MIMKTNRIMECLKAVLKAFLYFAVYYLMQIVVMFGFSAGISVHLAMNAVDAMDAVLMTETVYAQILENAMLITLTAGVLTLLTYWILFLIRRKKFAKEVGVCRIPTAAVLPIVLLAAGFNVITSAFISILPWPESWMESYMTSSAVIDHSFFAWITAVFMAPVLEEVVFRGLIYSRLKKGMPALAAAVITSLAFGMAHGTMIWAIYTFIFSMVLIWVFEMFQSLTACILLHMAYNISGMALSLIPENAGVFVWILFAAAMGLTVWAYGRIKKCRIIENINKE